MNVTPEAIERLRRLARSLQSNGRTEKKEKGGKKEVEQNGKDNEEVNHAANGGSLSVNGKKKEVTSSSSKQTKDEGEIKMDVNVFHQILKEVIIKRTLSMEKQLMGDVEGLKKQVSELEAQKKRLQCDSERLLKALNEISSKQGKKKDQMISCETQVDMDLLQERSLSPEISKPIKLTSFSDKSISSIRTQQSEIVNDNPPTITELQKMVAHKTDVNEESLEEVKTDDRNEFRVLCNSSGINTGHHIPVVAEVASRELNGGEIEISICPPSQAQRIATESSATRGNQNGQHMPQYQPQVAQPNLSTYTPHSELGFDVSFVRQQQGNMNQQLPRPEIPQHTQTRVAATEIPQHTQTYGPPPSGPRIQGVSSINSSVIAQHQAHHPPTLTESLQSRRPQYSSSKWMSSQQQQPHRQVQQVQAAGPGDVRPQPHLSANRGPSYQANHRSVARGPRVPPNVSPFQPPKRRRVENHQASDSLRMHVVSSNSNYVMHNFKVQKSPWSLVERGRQDVTATGPLPTNQLVYTNSPSNPPASEPLPTSQVVYTNSQCNPSNQLPMTYLSQGYQKRQPAGHRGQYPAPNRPPAGLSQGQLVERVLYPSTVSQPGRSEHYNDPRVMPADPNRHVEGVSDTNQPVEPNGTVYVVQEYQVTQNRGAPLQPTAPAPTAVHRNLVCPPVQSPGISSTASSSGYRPGDQNAGHIPRNAPNKPDSSVLSSDHSQVDLKSPPKPTASIVVVQDGIVLSWNLQLEDNSAKIDNYELFACQDGAESTNPPIMWKKIGIVKALPLPMACTLTQFSAGNKYHFAVRAVDDQERAGPFSDPCTISLTA